MDGVVLVAGVFQPGSVVRLIKVPDERVLRPEGHDIIGQRIVDEQGNVGFDGLEVGGRYFVTGYVNGTYVLVRALGVDAGAPNSELQQPPITTTLQSIGTQEAKVIDLPPALPDGAASLPVGVPPAADPANPSTEHEPVKHDADVTGEHEPPTSEDEPMQSDAAPQGVGTSTATTPTTDGATAATGSVTDGAPLTDPSAPAPVGGDTSPVA